MSLSINDLTRIFFEGTSLSHITSALRDGSSMLYISVFLALLIGYVVIKLVAKPRNNSRLLPFDIEGELIYADEGRRSKIFYNSRYNISGKPDFIVKLKSGELAAVEYKNRDRGIYSSDIAQLKAVVIAVSSSILITRAFVVNNNEKKEVRLEASTDAIYNSISQYYTVAEKMKNNPNYIEYQYTDNERKCTNCSVRNACSKVA